jgi:hypothetical protein
VDAEAALDAEEPNDFAIAHNILIVVAPKTTGWLVNIADHYVHSVFKRSYYSDLSRSSSAYFDPISKFEAWRRAFWSVSDAVVEHAWVANGLFSEEPPEMVADRLLAEGMKLSARFISMHQQQLRAYLDWRRGHGFDFRQLEDAQFRLKMTPYWNIIEQYLH